MSTNEPSIQLLDPVKHRVILRAAAKHQFWAYCCYADFEFFAIRRRFLKPVADLLQKVYDEYVQGNAINVSISLPPRSGKSYIVSLFCAWWLGKVQHAAIMRNSCTKFLYDKLSRDTRSMLQSRAYKDVFPEVRLSKTNASVSGWSTNRATTGVSYFGAGVNGTIIGFGCTLAITDDLYKSYMDALSDTTNENVKSWNQSAHGSRKETNCPEIYIGTRWVSNDVIGEAVESGKVPPENVISIAALDEYGNSFCEYVKTTHEYKKIKAEVDEPIWLAEYMQTPLEIKGILFPKHKLRFEDFSHYDFSQALWRVAVGDPADTGGDFNSTLFAYVMPNLDVVIRKVIFNKDGVEVNAERTANALIQHRPEKTIIEANGGWISYVKLVKDYSLIALKKYNKHRAEEALNSGEDYIDLVCPVTPFKSTLKKEVRILANYEFVLRHCVFDAAYEDDAEYAAFIANLTKWKREGKNANDDAPDNIAALVNFVKVKFNLLHTNEQQAA